jgi:hypothetical protein
VTPDGAVITPNGVRGAARDPTAIARPEAHLSGDVRIVPVEIKEYNERLRYELDISYPQIEQPRTAGERGFNRLARALVERDLRDFRAHCAKERKRPDGTERKGYYSFEAEYEVFYAAGETLSVMLTQHFYTGYLNKDHFNVPLNYDLRRGRQLSLSDLFKPRAKFLEAIASHCLSEFEARGQHYGSGCGVGHDHQVREGAAPKAENYDGWALARNGLLIAFDEYQVGPGCAGMIDVVVPYERLKDMLRPGLKLPPASAETVSAEAN